MCCCVVAVVLWQAIKAVIERIDSGLGRCWRWCFSVGMCFLRHNLKGTLRAVGLSVDIILIIIMIK